MDFYSSVFMFSTKHHLVWISIVRQKKKKSQLKYFHFNSLLTKNKLRFLQLVIIKQVKPERFLFPKLLLELDVGKNDSSVSSSWYQIIYKCI